MRDPSLGGTLGQRQNDDLVRDLARHGSKDITMNTQQAKEMLEKLKSDPRLKLTNPETGRRITITDLETKIQRMEQQDERERKEKELQEKIERNKKQIEDEEKQYEELLLVWRNLPRNPTQDDINEVLIQREFKPDISPPPPLDWDQEREVLVASVVNDIKSRFPYWLIPRFLLKTKAVKIADTMWESKKVELMTEYDGKVEDFQKEFQRRKLNWDAEEEATVNHWQRLIAGDLETMYNTAVATVNSIPFPFHTSCDIYLNEPSVVFVNMDLPEIEDVIPLFKKQALKNGEIREVRIDPASRNEDYFGLVIGQSILIAAHLFVYLRSLSSVRVAGYTQRPRKRESDDIDTYVFDITFPKDFIAGFNSEVEDLRPPIKSLTPIISLRTNWALDPIERPHWVPPT